MEEAAESCLPERPAGPPENIQLIYRLERAEDQSEDEEYFALPPTMAERARRQALSSVSEFFPYSSGGPSG